MTTLQPSTPEKEIFQTDVVIVGGELAGLSAAPTLTASGKDVLVLEATDRVGGRTYTIQSVHGTPIDMGGQWFGSTQKRIGNLAAAVGVTTFPSYDTGQTIGYHQGRRFLYPGLIPTTDPKAAQEIKQALGLLDEMATQVPLEAPWLAPPAFGMGKRLQAGWIRP